MKSEGRSNDGRRRFEIPRCSKDRFREISQEKGWSATRDVHKQIEGNFLMNFLRLFGTAGG